MTPNEIAQAARDKIAGNPELEAGLRVELGTVCDVIEARARDRLHERYHFQVHARVARLAMLTAFVEGKSMDEARNAALRAAGFEVHE